MKKNIVISFVILSFVISCFVILNNLHKGKTYIFETHIRVESNGRIIYNSTTEDFLAKMKNINFADKVIYSNQYSVEMKLNKIELKKIIKNSNIKKFYTSYDEYIERPHYDPMDIYEAS